MTGSCSPLPGARERGCHASSSPAPTSSVSVLQPCASISHQDGLALAELQLVPYSRDTQWHGQYRHQPPPGIARRSQAILRFRRVARRPRPTAHGPHPPRRRYASPSALRPYPGRKHAAKAGAALAALPNGSAEEAVLRPPTRVVWMVQAARQGGRHDLSEVLFYPLSRRLRRYSIDAPGDLK